MAHVIWKRLFAVLAAWEAIHWTAGNPATLPIGAAIASAALLVGFWGIWEGLVPATASAAGGRPAEPHIHDVEELLVEILTEEQERAARAALKKQKAAERIARYRTA